MRIAITSDVHFHFSWARETLKLVDCLGDAAPDLLILAGDIGEPLDLFLHGLQVFQTVCERRAAIAGNHDVWHREFSYDSRQLWESKLQEASAELGYHWLEAENMVIGSLGICGSIGWYDYGNKPPEIHLTDEEYRALKPLISNDGNYVNWPWTDQEFAQRLLGEVGQRLDELEENPDVADILAVTHVPLFRGFEREPDHPASAYYANISLGERVMQAAKLRTVVSGHVHIGHTAEIKRDGLPPFLAHSIPADYGEPAALLLDTADWTIETICQET